MELRKVATKVIAPRGYHTFAEYIELQPMMMISSTNNQQVASVWSAKQ
jgi:hypothetical protein